MQILHFIKSNLDTGEVRDRGTNAICTIRTQKGIAKLMDIYLKIHWTLKNI